MKRVKFILGTLLSFFLGIFISRHIAYKKIVEESDIISKYICLFKFANEWIILKQRGIEFKRYFKERGYNSIAVYGMGDLGERFVDEVKNTDINIEYAIDRCRKGKYANIEIKNFDGALPKVDAVVVTPIYNFWEIRPSLTDRFECPVVSLEDVVCECNKII